jgi:cytochrome b561
MATGRDGLMGRLHVAVALAAAWLVFTSPWIDLGRRLPKHPGFFDWSHVVIGLLALALSASYLASCVRAGRWRLYFPWLAGQGAVAVRELAGLFKGRIPSAEGGGLFALIEGLALLAFFATAVTGAAWLLTQGSADALTWREVHSLAARVLIGCAAVHVVTVSLHLLDLVRD